MIYQNDRLTEQKWKDVRNNLWEEWKCISESHPIVLWVNQKMTNDDIVTDFVPWNEDFALTGPVGHCHHSIPLCSTKLNFWLTTLCAGLPRFRRFRDSVLPTVFLQQWHVKVNFLTCARGWLVKILGKLNLSVTDPHYCFEKDVLIMILNLVNCLIFCSWRAVLGCKKMMRK